MGREQVAWNRQERGFSCDIWTDLPGQAWADFVHAGDELVMWIDGEIHVWALREHGYERVARSELLPALDFDELLPFMGRRDQTRSVREYRALQEKRAR